MHRLSQGKSNSQTFATIRANRRSLSHRFSVDAVLSTGSNVSLADFSPGIHVTLLTRILLPQRRRLSRKMSIILVKVRQVVGFHFSSTTLYGRLNAVLFEPSRASEPHPLVHPRKASLFFVPHQKVMLGGENRHENLQKPPTRHQNPSQK